MTKLVSIIVPVHNERENVGVMAKAIKRTFADLPYRYNLLFVDDGSSDLTLHEVKKLALQDDHVRYISFSRNFGHQAAIKAGLDKADGDCIITMDGDMQHPPSLIPTLLEKWEEGYDVVYTVRKEDKKLPFLKRVTSNLFYRVLNWLSDIKIEKGTADFRLMNRNVVDVLRGLAEFEPFFRGLVKWAGFKQVPVEYEPNERKSGASKYTSKKMIRFALQGITSFSIRPLYAATYIGFTFAALSTLYIPYALYSYYFGYTISGWSSLIVTVVFFGGLQLMILGIIGIYLGKLFMQNKHRPVYIVKESNIHEPSAIHIDEF
ncbi:glycosyl transferase family 2 [Niastella yeongjuensis]|uniref:Glycosyl transferase family 2 n=1 Tax=Niastella yeongjuensis TaxID=354355 RepID=A0A1V9EWS0_9BACT|nr:glycosyltransferase family 2 protein [Niastella yeongjuensis]OQP50596.1 glycosyl transferase family 2 [Niastella yeongjuensis]SEN26924.1 dolichol-phosphate mannosyltransferase [Niastella yeongjuensis]